MSKIEWTGDTWNPLLGCSKVSPGCKNCYAIQTAWIRMHNPKMSERYAGVVEKTAAGSLNWTGKVNMVREALVKPLKKKNPTIYFVNSMSDLFHEAVPFEFIDEVFCIMAACRQHTFQVLTKRPDRMLEYFSTERPGILDAILLKMMNDGLICGSHISFVQEVGLYNWPLANVWLGTSVENQKTADERIPLLLQVPAAVRFLSCEPLLGPIDISSWLHTKEMVGMEVSNIEETEFSNLKNDLHWVIVGGESGPGARPARPDWFLSLRDQCQAASVAFFFKQWGEWRIYDHWDGDNARPLGVFYFDEFKEGNYIIDPAKNSIHMAKVGKKKAGRLLDGREWNELPVKKESW